MGSCVRTCSGDISVLAQRSFMCAHVVGVHVLVAAVAVAAFGFCGHYQIEEYILCLFCVCVAV